jgi:ATP/maltotriose-dependent transcriptional regulator MalT
MALEAYGLASSEQPVEAAVRIADAERAFTRERGATSSNWLSPFDATSLAIKAARCFLRIGDFAEAQRQLQIALTPQNAGRVRSRALAQLMLVTTLVTRGEVDEACTLTQDAVASTRSLGSVVLVDQLRHVSLLLGPHARRSAQVPPLLERLNETVRERAWISATGSLHETTAAARMS